MTKETLQSVKDWKEEIDQMLDEYYDSDERITVQLNVVDMTNLQMLFDIIIQEEEP